MQDRIPDIQVRLAAAQLPALPQILLRIVELCERDDVGLAELGGVVGKDAGIAARVVAIANSPYYNRGRAIDTVDKGLAVLGTTTVRRIALNQAVIELFGRFRGARGFDLGPFWRHTLLTAVLARQIAQQLGYPNPEEAYLAGLLHDVGRLALLTVAQQDYLPLFESWREEASLLEDERALFGMDHAQTGAWLAERWQLHPFFADALRYHHEPPDRILTAHQLVQAVALADRLGGIHPSRIEDLSDILALWGLDAQAGARLLEAGLKEIKTIADQFGITLPDAPPPPAPVTEVEALDKVAELTSSRVIAQGALPEGAAEGSIDATLVALAQGASLLFGARRSALFRHDQGRLQGRSLDGLDSRIDEIRLPLPAVDTALGKAWAGKTQILLAGMAGNSLADAQILGVLGGEGMVCLSLAHEGMPLGVLVLGLDMARTLALRHRPWALDAFAAEAGRLLGQATRREAELEQTRQGLGGRFERQARAMVHEAGNPLGVVRNYLAILRGRLSEQAAPTQEIDLMEEELRRVTRIIQGLRQVDLSAAPERQRLDVNGLVQDVLRFCRMGKAEMRRVEVVLALEEGLPAVMADADKLKQVLINLVFNAAEALPQGGRLTLSTARWRGAKGGESVEIGIADNGPGLPPEVMGQLYGPVATAKGGAHAGLGLSIVGRLVEELGGAIQCRSASTGTVFKLVLPAAA